MEYILVRALPRVLVGADEISEEFDLVIPKGARDSTDAAIPSFVMRAEPCVDRDGDAWIYWHRLGQIKAREVPKGTKGYRDLRRRAERVRPWVASPGDLVRMMEACGRPEEAGELESMRRVVELDRGQRLAPEGGGHDRSFGGRRG